MVKHNEVEINSISLVTISIKELCEELGHKDTKVVVVIHLWDLKPIKLNIVLVEDYKKFM